MTLLEADTKLRQLGLRLITTSDAAAALGITGVHACKILSRLDQAKRVVRLIRGRWALLNGIDRDGVDPLSIPEHLTAPSPSYISLQTALYHHGIISQIPSIVYAISLMPTHEYRTPLGTFSIHHVSPDFFFGFDVIGKQAIKMAWPEKALVDILYLSPARSGLFASLPELEIPHKFKKKLAYEIVSKIPWRNRQSLVLKKLEDIL